MSNMSINEQIEILEAYRDGKRVERQGFGRDCWELIRNPSYCFAFGADKYRIVKTGKERLREDWDSIRMSKPISGPSEIINDVIDGKYGELKDDLTKGNDNE